MQCFLKGKRLLVKHEGKFLCRHHCVAGLFKQTSTYWAVKGAQFVCCADHPAALSVPYTCHTIITTDLSPCTTASQHIPFTFPLWGAPLLKRGVEKDMQSLSSTETVNCDCYTSQARLFHDGTISAVGVFRDRRRSKNMCSRQQFRVIASLL